MKTKRKLPRLLQYLKAVRELEKFKALSKGKKTAVIVGAIAIVLVVALIVYFLVRPEPGTPVTLVSVQKGDIQQELIATGTIESDNQTDFSLLEGTKGSHSKCKSRRSCEEGRRARHLRCVFSIRQA